MVEDVAEDVDWKAECTALHAIMRTVQNEKAAAVAQAKLLQAEVAQAKAVAYQAQANQHAAEAQLELAQTELVQIKDLMGNLEAARQFIEHWNQMRLLLGAKLETTEPDGSGIKEN